MNTGDEKSGVSADRVSESQQRQLASGSQLAKKKTTRVLATELTALKANKVRWMSESQFNKYEQEVKRLENELNLVESAIPTQQAAEKYVECPLRFTPSPPALSPTLPRLSARPLSPAYANCRHMFRHRTHTACV